MPRQKVVWLFTGSRDWPYELQPKLEKSLDKLGVVTGPGGDLVIHGKAAGFDSAVHMWARRRGAMIAEVQYPNWSGTSRFKGGPLRNLQMIEIAQGLSSLGYRAQIIVGHKDRETLETIPRSGTRNCRDAAQRKGFRISYIWGHYA